MDFVNKQLRRLDRRFKQARKDWKQISLLFKYRGVPFEFWVLRTKKDECKFYLLINDGTTPKTDSWHMSYLIDDISDGSVVEDLEMVLPKEIDFITRKYMDKRNNRKAAVESAKMRLCAAPL